MLLICPISFTRLSSSSCSSQKTEVLGCISGLSHLSHVLYNELFVLSRILAGLIWNPHVLAALIWWESFQKAGLCQKRSFSFPATDFVIGYFKSCWTHNGKLSCEEILRLVPVVQSSSGRVSSTSEWVPAHHIYCAVPLPCAFKLFLHSHHFLREEITMEDWEASIGTQSVIFTKCVGITWFQTVQKLFFHWE